MKVLQDGKEVKGAKVAYFTSGQPSHVIVGGVAKDITAFKLVDEEPVKKTRTAPKSQSNAAGAMTTKDVRTK